jgi:PIN domain nuclease of toxin-antitoxin system
MCAVAGLAGHELHRGLVRGLPAGCRDRIEQAERVGVSPVSCYELALAHRRGRLQLPCASAKWFAEALAPAGAVQLRNSANHLT